ncbi:hypothetical protein JM84_3052 [Dokdonia sp. Hel_I_63]|uniref:hypothetical protein n=1 Tax=Dokdonia sp. Hel_I_63 TaxID=1249996 RepID=UPI00119BBC13|nr:hypothetical protein [Dokdonia sp. Hel_I_63]TVZ24093.1 hypothetical protein JM84_3052 [Dokdonia sp. Hel_I_63]
MKQFYVLLAVFLVGCSSDDGNDDTSTESDFALGEWKSYQTINQNGTFPTDECNFETFFFFDDLSGSYSLTTGMLVNGDCQTGSGGFGFDYEYSSNSTFKIFISVIDVYQGRIENNELILNPIDGDTQEVDNSTSIFLQKQ